MAKSSKPKFYAVARGRKAGIYLDWDTCKAQVDGFPSARFKSFPTREAASTFMMENGGPYVPPTSNLPPATSSHGMSDGRLPPSVTALAFTPSSSAVTHGNRKRKISDQPADHAPTAVQHRPLKSRKSLANSSTITTHNGRTEGSGSGYTEIWTDGSSRGNGTVGAIAGLGVFFGPGDPRNVAERLPGPRQTNQRAELTAIIRALEVMSGSGEVSYGKKGREEDVEIKSDSQYAINCFTVWHQAWSANGWRNSKKQPVENQELVRKGLALLRQRTGRTRFVKVPAHTGILGNEMADRLANEGAMKPARFDSEPDFRP